MPPTYSCNVLGSCSGLTAQQTSLFRDLQREINRVRSANGLAPDCPVDGKIGPVTTAKLIKLVDKMMSAGVYATSSSDGTVNYAAKLDNSLRMNLTSQVVAANALNILQALQRNGFSMPYWSISPDAGRSSSPGGIVPVTINPYTSGVTVNPGAKINVNPVVSVLPVGPTAPTGPGIMPGSYASPAFSSEMPTWAKVGLGILGAAAAVGIGVGVVRAVRG